ncbi:hypothetical protein FSPOR_9279 [Fusarium sporotrichioides]|uniref:Ecp2 effector protein domain-containing protein n=1 Tax=Fusarium sporotrichioides TaxID=5514 RepID=A0A395RRF3_FUSSP|nr:hypothetical protein FSPOR_9279 [Fusarium sporotrichioides]
MHHYQLLLLLAYLIAEVLGVEAPIEGYGVVVPEWEVEVAPGTSTILKGTVEEVHSQLLGLNPDWDEMYILNAMDPITETSRRDKDTHLFRRTNFEGSKYTCRGRWPQCPYPAIVDGIEYLRYVQAALGTPPSGGVMISKTLNGFGSIADGAEYILNKCGSQGWSNGVSGQVFHKTNWNVIVRKDKC